jgi:hypothetical protein
MVENAVSDSKKLVDLNRRLDLKCYEIKVLVAGVLGLKLYDPILSIAVDKLIEEFEASECDGATVRYWRSQDVRLAGAPIAQLLYERHGIAQKLASLVEDAGEPKR